MANASNNVELPRPSLAGKNSLEQLLAKRRSIREYADGSLQLAEISQLLWAAQGITHANGLRTAPSAGALYPLELYVVVGRSPDLASGVYRYDPKRHQLQKSAGDDVRDALAQAALSQDWVKTASAVMVFAADYERTTKKYGKRGLRYVHMEVGHAAQNLFLQAESLGLASVVVGAFNDDKVAQVLQLPSELQPLLLMPIGRK